MCCSVSASAFCIRVALKWQKSDMCLSLLLSFCGANAEKLLTLSGVEGIEEGAAGNQLCSAIA